ncbi:hypothetical protein FYF33_20120 [Salmonella enterica]|nr:hypothetical protein [Salmonella enterica]
MIAEYQASNGKLYTFFSDRIHKPKPEITKPKRFKAENPQIEGKPCINCGNTKRYYVSGRCVYCQKEHNKLKNKG